MKLNIGGRGTREQLIDKLREWHKKQFTQDRRGVGSNFSLLEVELPPSPKDDNGNPLPRQGGPSPTLLSPLRVRQRYLTDGTPKSILSARKGNFDPTDSAHKKKLSFSIFNGTKIIPPRDAIRRRWAAEDGIDLDAESSESDSDLDIDNNDLLDAEITDAQFKSNTLESSDRDWLASSSSSSSAPAPVPAPMPMPVPVQASPFKPLPLPSPATVASASSLTPRAAGPNNAPTRDVSVCVPNLDVEANENVAPSALLSPSVSKSLQKITNALTSAVKNTFSRQPMVATPSISAFNAVAPLPSVSRPLALGSAFARVAPVAQTPSKMAPTNGGFAPKTQSEAFDAEFLQNFQDLHV